MQGRHPGERGREEEREGGRLNDGCGKIGAANTNRY